MYPKPETEKRGHKIMDRVVLSWEEIGSVIPGKDTTKHEWIYTQNPYTLEHLIDGVRDSIVFGELAKLNAKKLLH